MKSPEIAYMMSRFPKLTETFILYEILALENSGTPVAVYPLLRERAAVTHPEVERVMPSVRFFPFLSPEILGACASFLFRKPFRLLTTIVSVLWQTRKSRNFFVGALGVFPKAMAIAKEMESRGIRHIHAHFATHPALAAYIVHRMTGISFSFTAHGSDLHVDRTMLGTKVDAAKFVVTVSGFNREVIVDECGEWSREKVRIVHCGVDPEIFSAAQGSDDGKFRVICVGSFEEVKGHRYLVEACEHLRNRGIEIECHFVGDGPRRDEVVEQIQSAGLDAQIVVHGGLPRNRVLELLGSVDAIALPSVPTAEGKREGIPVALMEGMVSGLPVVSSRLSGIPELVQHEVSGFLVEPRDSVGIADALQSLAEDRDLRQRMGAAGRRHVVEHFNLPKNAAELVRYFGGEGEAAEGSVREPAAVG